MWFACSVLVVVCCTCCGLITRWFIIVFAGLVVCCLVRDLFDVLCTLFVWWFVLCFVGV